jgi:hypothetical protein
VRHETGPILTTTADEMTLDGHVAVYVNSLTATLLGGQPLTLGADTPPPAEGLDSLLGVTSASSARRPTRSPTRTRCSSSRSDPPRAGADPGFDRLCGHLGIEAHGAVVQWQNFCFPSRQRGFDSRQPLHLSFDRPARARLHRGGRQDTIVRCPSTICSSPWSDSASALRDLYLRWVRTAGDVALRREGGPEHVTASCFRLPRSSIRSCCASIARASSGCSSGAHRACGCDRRAGRATGGPRGVRHRRPGAAVCGDHRSGSTRPARRLLVPPTGTSYSPPWHR